MQQYKSFGKRAFDLMFSLLALPFLIPIFLLAVIGILLDDGRPIFFKQQRVGKNGKLFTMWKFRTMYMNHTAFSKNEEDRSSWTNGIPDTFVFKDGLEDPRITKVGQWLRKTSIDELPQILNVLKGEMSIVGPRPETPSYTCYYSPYQKKRLDVKPGITGWAQVNGRSAINHGQKIELDRYYVTHYNFKMDAKIVQKTVIQVIKRRGAY